MDPKDVVIFSDMDGTLLSSWELGPIIVEKNLQAMKKWRDLGGSFSIATGRNLKNALHFFHDYQMEIPVVLANGALLYSHTTGEILHKELVPQAYIDEAIQYFENNNRIALVISDESEVYAVKHKHSRNIPKLDFPAQEISLETIKSLNVLKATFVVFAEDSEKVNYDLTQFNSINEVNVMPSSIRFIEVVSKKATKALGIKRALKGLQKKIVCIGDYLNDIEMLDIADISACPEHSHELVKKRAQITTVSNNEGAIADLINQLLTS